jgi:hypothetical protein
MGYEIVKIYEVYHFEESYVDMSMRLEVKMTGCPTGYLAYLLTLGYKLSIKRYIIEYKL